MTTQKAIVQKSKGVTEFRTDVPLPKLPAGNWVLVKTKAVALNPTDWKAVEWTPSAGALVGCDYAGIVEEVGSEVTELKMGDKVAGFIRGGDPADHFNGAFAEHVKAKVGPHLKISDNLSFEDASTLGVGITTVGQALYQELGLPLPPNKVSEPTTILIYGASTATGSLAIQYAKLSGCEVIAIASPHNFDLLRELGADHVLNYKDADVGSKIRKATDDKLKLIFDCISEGSSHGICAAAMSSTGGHYTALLPTTNFPRKDVKTKMTIAYTAIGERYNDSIPANQADYEFGSKFWKIAEELVNSGKIVTHRTVVRNGLEGIVEGLQELKDGKVSGTKLVYKVE